MSGDDDQPEKPASTSKPPRKKPVSRYYKANNEGGFGNPPISGQFDGTRPGPGRPPGVTSLESAIGKMLKSKLQLKGGGTADYLTALAIAAREASLAKTIAATRFGMELWDKYGPKDKQEVGIKLDFDKLSEVESVIFHDLFFRLLNEPPPEEPPNPLGTVFEEGEGLFRAAKGADGHLHLERVGDLTGEVTGRPNNDPP